MKKYIVMITFFVLWPGQANMILTFIRVTSIIIAWTLLMSIYSGDSDIITPAIAQNSEEDQDSPNSSPSELREIGPSELKELGFANYSDLMQFAMEKAIEEWDRVLAIEPNNFRALYNKGATLCLLGKYQEAMGYLDRALAIDPNHVGALNNKGIALYYLGMPEEAIGYFDRALAIEPNDVDRSNPNDLIAFHNHVGALINKGNTLAHLGRYEEAIEYYDRALAIEPNYAIVLYNKGSALANLQRYQEAIEYYDRALAIVPSNVNALNNTGTALLLLGMPEEAIGYFDRALAIEPNDVGALNNKGIALYILERYQEAIGYFDRALAIEPNDVNVLYNKGTSIADLGNYEEAIVYYDKILSIDPNFGPALTNKGAALGNLGRHQEAAKYFETSSSVQESSISNVSSIKKKPLVLITNVEKKSYSMKNSLPSYANLGFENLRSNNFNGHKETYQLQYILHSNQIDVTKRVNDGINKFHNGEYQVAILIFDEILTLNNQHPDELVQNQQLAASLYNKGLCLEQQGNLTGAEHYKNEGHSLDPQYEGGNYINQGPEISAPALIFVISEPSG